MTELDTQPNTIELATELTIAWLQNPNTRASAEDVPAFLDVIHKSIGVLFGSDAPVDEPLVQDHVPAVTVRKSLASPDHIISMIDGKPYRTLRRHLATHGMSPEQYRERYSLKSDYPMVAPSYSESRRAMAHKIGLGRKPTAEAVTVTGDAPESETPAPARKPRARGK